MSLGQTSVKSRQNRVITNDRFDGKSTAVLVAGTLAPLRASGSVDETGQKPAKMGSTCTHLTEPEPGNENHAHSPARLALVIRGGPGRKLEHCPGRATQCRDHPG